MSSLLLSLRDLVTSHDRQNDIVAGVDEFVVGLRVCELTHRFLVHFDDHVARLQTGLVSQTSDRHLVEQIFTRVNKKEFYHC